MSEIMLMCTPEWFTVNYEINPWMKNQTGRVSHELARQQWQALYDTLCSVAEIRLMRGAPSWPDLVFTANVGLPLAAEKKIILSNFRHPERQGEKAINRSWFEDQGWRCIDLPDGVIFEGAGDALFDDAGRLWTGSGPRSDETALMHLARHIDAPIFRLALTDPRFYHLDTCFCPLPDGYALYLPLAFDEASRALLERSFEGKLISLTPEEGDQFCANAVCAGSVIVMNQSTPRLDKLLADIGFSVIETAMSEFMKSGGSAKCLTLSLQGWAKQ
ncbi:MAG: arginine deiminase-related protein [Gallionella sp.]|nr:arginine deiminase-related protein [Gallionella sp.]